MTAHKIGLVIVVALGVVGTASRALAEFEKESDTCVVCHEQETKEWTESSHAKAINDRFLAEWKREGEKWECLVCHASKYDRQTKAYGHDGVSCQSCHGPASEDHPDKVKKLLPVTSATCQTCHSVTYGEWRISAHGQKEIRCFDCHKMHGMRLRKHDPDQMCGSCHTERLQDYSHATHHEEGVLCITCHMPEAMAGTLKIKGTGARGHTFTVGAQTCAGCHREMVHAKSDRAELEEEIKHLKEISPVALQAQVQQQQADMEKLNTALRMNRRVFSVIVIVAFALGVFIEYTILHHRRKPHGDQEEQP
jgi:hypothetical protein